MTNFEIKFNKTSGRRSEIDKFANVLNTDFNLQNYRRRINSNSNDFQGFPIGTLPNSKKVLYSQPSQNIILFGAGLTNKTSSYTIPYVNNYHGPTIVSFDHSLLMSETREQRQSQGNVFLFDSLRASDEKQDFWINLLDIVTDQDSAISVSKVFLKYSDIETRSQGLKYREEIEALLASYFLACVLKRSSFESIRSWCSTNSLVEVSRIIKGSDANFLSVNLDQIISTKSYMQTALFFEIGQILADFLNTGIIKWFVPPKQNDLPQFDTNNFLEGDNTLYVRTHPVNAPNSVICTVIELICNYVKIKESMSRNNSQILPLLVVSDENNGYPKNLLIDHICKDYQKFNVISLSTFHLWRDVSLLFDNENILGMYLGGNTDKNFAEYIKGKVEMNSNSKELSHLADMSVLRCWPHGSLISTSKLTKKSIYAPQRVLALSPKNEMFIAEPPLPYYRYKKSDKDQKK
jgi:hypothetical protein